MVNRASYFVTLVMLSSILSPTEYGIFGLLYSLANSIASINSSTLGIPTRRELVQLKTPAEGIPILKINLLIITLLTGVILLATSIYYEITKDVANNFSNIPNLHIFHLACNLSISHYLGYHFGGIRRFAAYNKLLLPVNILLPLWVFIFPPETTSLSIILISAITLLGNLAQIIYLINLSHTTSPHHSRGRDFIKRNSASFIPCFLQSLLGLPVFFLLQLTITTKWQDFILIGVITLATQLLNISNIFATRILTVLSPRITKQFIVSKNIPRKYFLRLLCIYTTTITGISLVIILVLPLLLDLTKSNFLDYVEAIRYFVMVNVLSCVVWFIQEYFHAINKSSISLYTNIIFSALLLAVFWGGYYWHDHFNLVDYANCMAVSRALTIIISIPILVHYGKIH